MLDAALTRWLSVHVDDCRRCRCSGLLGLATRQSFVFVGSGRRTRRPPASAETRQPLVWLEVAAKAVQTPSPKTLSKVRFGQVCRGFQIISS